ncbi:hypothetical protein UA08_03743 [Talaromyces atroroseus]|uniref:RanBD1 domain-containing protein n=1 Tax=Talaromyces atroroseus TaxID=1441469 RepID=A0A225AIN8_TALAT|nr:hypothetical protein UA08_03743 [Talaromyces atroroseus]OKL61322.1 hypothetical protein UA08_03743 [Talaromyces atroroseus]
MSSTPNDTPQRATAAQMASRKIKELNRRRTKPSTPSTPQAAFSFGESIPGVAAPSTNSTASNGFSFGQSQSFPGAAPSSGTQNGSSISFGSGGSSNFNFGGFTASNNPFANLNGASQPQNQTTNLFGGQSSTMPSQNPSPGLFGQTSAAPSASPPIFQSQPAGSGSGLFGQSTTTAPSGSGFQPQPASSGSTLFGQSTTASTSAPNPFAQSTSIAPSTTSQPAAATTAPPSMFGQSSTSAAPASSIFQPKPAATTTGSSLFGQNAPATTTGGTNLFGQTSAKAPSDTGTTANGPTSLFSQSSTASTSGPSLFQPKAATSGAGNLFGQTTPSTGIMGGTSLFGQPTASKNEGASIFAPSTPNKSSAAATSAAPSNIFSFGQPATSTTQKPLFGLANDVDDMSTSPDGKQKTGERTSAAPSLFGQKAAQTSDSSAPETARPTLSLFGSSTPATAANPPATSLGSSTSLFGQQEPKSATPSGVAASSVFAPTAAPAAASSSSNPFQSLFTGPSKPATTTTPAPSLSTSTSTSSQSLFAGISKPATTTTPTTSVPITTSGSSQSLFTGAAKQAQTKTPPSTQQTPSQRLGGTIMDKGPAATSTAASVQAPSGLSSGEILDDKKRSQIRDLNRGFKELVASYDPETQSLDSVILHYVRLRKAINAPVGSLANKPGKRKLDDAHGIESPAQRTFAKKSKAQEPEPEFPSYSPVTSSTSKRKSSEDLEDGSAGKRRAQAHARPATTGQNAAGKSETSNIFASSFSSGSKAPTDAVPELKKPVTTSDSSRVFGLKPSAPSETETPRPASPQKKLPEPATKPAFQVPNFGNLAGQNFTGQFGQGSFKQSSTETPKVNIEVPKFGASGQNFMSQFVKQAKEDDTDEDSSDSDAEPQPEKPVDKVAPPVLPQPKTTTSSSIFDSKPATPSLATNNIFGHLTNSNTNSDAGESSDDDITGQLKKRAKNNQPVSEAENASESKSTASLFGRITKPDGTPVHVSSDEDKSETPKPKPLFGQGAPTNPFAASNSNGTPSLFSSVSTPKTSNIFGGPQPSTSNPFSSISSNVAAHLLPNHGGTTTTSVTSDSNADETDTETYKDSQLNLMTNAGEEDEEVLYEGRSRAMKFVEKQSEGKTEKTWEVQGVGQLRLLVNKEAKRARIVLRAEPSGRAVLNTAINRAIDYKVQPGSCQFLVPRADGSGMDLWGLRFKKEVTAEVENALKSAKDSLSN